MNHIYCRSAKFFVLKNKGLSFKNPTRFIMFVLLFIAFGMIGNNSAYGQISTLNSWTNQYHNTATTTQNVTYTIPTGSNTNRILIVAIASSQTATGSRTVSVTYGGQALTSVAAGDMATATTRQHTQFYYLNESGIDAATSTTLSFSVSGGTTRITDVFTAVYDWVDQVSPITDSENYNSVATTTNPKFATALNVAANGLAIEIISSVRTGNNSSVANITYANNWSYVTSNMLNNGSGGNTDHVINAIATRSVPTTATTDVSSTTFNQATLASMTALSLNASPNVSNFSLTAAATCIGSGAVVTVSSSSLATDNYTVTYTVSGTNTVSTSTAALSFTAGSPGTTTFATSALSTAGPNNVVNITKITNSAGNSVSGSPIASTTAFTTYSTPTTPGVITGPTTTAICLASNSTTLTYSISALANATSYTWTVPSGWTINSGQGTTSITVTPVVVSNGTVSVKAVNPCGNSGASSLTVNVTSTSCTFYSVQSGAWNTLSTWSLTNHTVTNVPTALPSASDAVIIGGSDAVTIPAGYTASANTLTVSDDASTCSLASASTGGLNITGNLTVNSSGTFNFSGTNTVTFSGSVAQTISGNGIITFNGLKLNNSAASPSNLVNVNQNITVNGVLTFSAANLLVVNSSSNVTLGSAGTIAGTFTAGDRYIQLDGLSGANSNLINVSAGTTASWAILYPIGTATGGYTPVDLTGHVTTNPTNGATLSVKAIYNNSIQGQLRRVFRLVVSNNSATTTIANAQFNYSTSTDVSTGDAASNYSTTWFLAASSGSWASVTGTNNYSASPSNFTVTTATSLQSGASATITNYYTIGNTTAYPNTWYSYQTGKWSNWQNWTLDPSGTTLSNGLNLPPQPGDAIVILNGITITNDVSGQVTSSATINAGATLDMVATTGNTLGAVSGSGTLRIKGINLPTGTYTAFVTASTGGTVEYYDVGGTLPAVQTTYNNLKLSGYSASATFIEANNLTVNGIFTVGTGSGSNTATWQINDGSANQRTITLNSDLNVASNGAITVLGGTTATGTTATPHAITMYGNFTNNGTVRFFDNTASAGLLSDANWNANTAGVTASNSVSVQPTQGFGSAVTFSSTNNQTVTCSGITYFYNLIVNKGTGTQAILNINSSSVTNFRLYGPANWGSTDGGETTNDGTGNTLATSQNALSIANGTLELTGSITIPILEVGNTVVNDNHHNSLFALPQTAELWLNGANVSVTVADLNTNNGDQRFLLQGNLRITNGTFNTGYSKGVSTGAAGVLMIEGGTLNTWQIRSATVGQQNFSYIQSGGISNIGPIASIAGSNQGGVASPGNQYARFSILTGSFQMTGGVLNIGTPSQYTSTGGSGGGGGGIDIQSALGNYNVTGGTVNVYIPSATDPNGNGPYTLGIFSTAPLANLNIYKDAGTNTTSYAFLGQSLTILNNFTINGTNAPTLVCNNNNLTIGGNFTINNGSTFTTGTTGTPAGTGTITFNGTGAQTWTYSSTGTVLTGNTVVVSKTAGTTLSVAAGTTLPSIGTLTLTSGTFNDNGSTVTVTTALTNNAVHTSGTGGSITYSKASGLISGSNGTFGNLVLTASNSVYSTNGNQTVTGNLQLNGATTKCDLNIGTNNLTVNGAISSSTLGIGGASYIVTSGLHNAGGLTLTCVKGTALLFPVGSSGYTPVTITVNTATTTGTITVIPVNREHPNVTQTGQSLKYYWRVISSGFTGLGTASGSVVHSNYSYGTTTLLQNYTTNYVAARYDRSSNTWGQCTKTFNVASPGPGAIVPASFNTGSTTNTWTGVSGDQLDGEYTCGNGTASGNNAFGTVTVYYSRTTGNWNTASTWSNVSNTGVAASTTPCANCPVIIGDGTLAHTVTIPNAAGTAQMCGSLSINANATLDCSRNAYAEGALGFGTNTTSVVNGTGTLRIELFNSTAGSNQTTTPTAGTGHFPSGDFTSFIGSGGGTVEYYGTSTTAFTIPSTYNSPASTTQPLTSYYNLVVSPASGQTITLPNSGLTVYNNLTQGSASGYTGTVLTNGSQTINVGGNLSVSYGTFSFSSANPSVTTLSVNGNTTVGSGAALTTQGGGTANVNTFTTSGNVTNNGTINFNNTQQVNLTFTGTISQTINNNGSSSLKFNNVTVNKGTSQTSTVMLNNTSGGTVNTTASTSGWLTLVNGSFIFNDTNNSDSYTICNSITSGWTIPSTANLTVQAGTVTVVSGNATTADLFLKGSLTVSGGTVNVGVQSNTIDNDLEYASAGSPTITVSAGALNVNGAVRRPLNTVNGALVYNQSGGTVTVSGDTPANNSGYTVPAGITGNLRGIFEIENNSGSSFTMSGNSNLFVQAPTNGTGSYADLYLNPSSSSVTAVSGILPTINIGLAGTNNNFKLNVAPNIGNLALLPGLNGTGSNSTLYSNNLALLGNLLISYNPASPTTTNAYATLNTNSFNVSIAGNLNNVGGSTGTNYTGAYNGSLNTTIFNGTTNQYANSNSNSSFNNMTVSNTGATGSNTVLLSGTTSPALANLNILNGILDVGALPLTVNGNIVNSSSQVASTPATGSITLTTTTTASHTITSSNGSFTNLIIGGTSATTNNLVTVNGNMTINGYLDFNSTSTTVVRTLFIGANLLTFANGTLVKNVGNTRFVKTNGVSSDLGVAYNWTVNSGPSSFTYPIGTSTNYTPVIMSFNGSNSITTPGSYTVVPVNSRHPTSNPTGQQLLAYYWKVVNNGVVNNLNGTLTFQFPSALTSGSGGTYTGGYLDLGASTITSPPWGWQLNGTATATSFTFTNNLGTASSPVYPGSYPTAQMPSSGYEFDYSCGTSTSGSGALATLPVPIQPVYSRLDVANVANSSIGGNWTLATNWSSSSTGIGSPLSTVPSGVPVVILSGTRINLNVAGQNAFKTNIQGPTGLLVVTTTGHNLGIISGTGTMRTSQSTFPAGDYTAFVAAAGGTIEYDSTMSMNSRTTYNNILISSNNSTSSASTVTMTASDITLNGTLTIAAGNTLDDSQTGSSGNISIAKDFSNGGTFLEGSSNVAISGNLTNTGTFTDVSGAVSVAQNWSNTGTFNSGTGTVTFNGTAAQSVSGNSAFNNLTINQTGNVTLSGTGTTAVNGALTLTSGNIVSSTSNKLALTSTATSSGGSASSYVSGPMTKVLPSGSFTAPVGGVNASVNLYRPVAIANPSASDTWSFQYFGNNPTNDSYPNLTMNTADILTVSQYEYWVIKPNSSTSGDLTLSYGSGSYNGSSIIGAGGDITHLRIGHWDGTQWDLPTTTSTYSQTQTGNTTAGTVTVTGVNDFSPFTFASIDATPMSALPVRLISFTGRAINDVVQLNWETATETDNNYFEVLHSTSGTDFESIGRVKGNGTTNMAHSYSLIDRDPALGKNYYQLKQVDFDGQTTSTEVILVNVLNVEPMISIYPNPITQGDLLNVKFKGLQANGSTELQIYNMQGAKVFNTIVSIDAQGALDTTITLNNLSTGLYILNVQDKYVKIIVE